MPLCRSCGRTKSWTGRLQKILMKTEQDHEINGNKVIKSPGGIDL